MIKLRTSEGYTTLRIALYSLIYRTKKAISTYMKKRSRKWLLLGYYGSKRGVEALEEKPFLRRYAHIDDIIEYLNANPESYTTLQAWEIEGSQFSTWYYNKFLGLIPSMLTSWASRSKNGKGQKLTTTNVKEYRKSINIKPSKPSQINALAMVNFSLNKGRSFKGISKLSQKAILTKYNYV